MHFHNQNRGIPIVYRIFSVLLSDSIEMIPCHMALSEQLHSLNSIQLYNNTTLYVNLLMLVPPPPSYLGETVQREA